MLDIIVKITFFLTALINPSITMNADDTFTIHAINETICFDGFSCEPTPGVDSHEDGSFVYQSPSGIVVIGCVFPDDNDGCADAEVVEVDYSHYTPQSNYKEIDGYTIHYHDDTITFIKN